MRKKTLTVVINVPDSEPGSEKIIEEATRKLNSSKTTDVILFVDSVTVTE